MKKFLVTILSVLYLLSSSGAIVQLHYCMGRLTNWDFGHKKSSTCEKCGMDKRLKNSGGCCKDEHKFVKNSGDQKANESFFQFAVALSGTLPVAFPEIPEAFFTTIAGENPVANSPPRSGSSPVYLLNCNFRI